MSVSGRLYFDFAATTPARPDVVSAMLPFFGRLGNANSLHAEGRAARAAVDRARLTLARLIGATPREIIFTGGGSESDNLAILGAARAARRGRGGSAHVVTVATEHQAVLAAVDVLRDEGFAVTVLPVDGEGRVRLEEFEAALRPDTVLASVMLANNELGTLQPIAALARSARARGVVFHTDAVQAAAHLPLDVAELGVDLLSLSAHKLYGPQGLGLLYVRAGTPLGPLVVGGGQEAGLRAGTENVAGIVGFARAFELSAGERAAGSARLACLRDRLEAGLAAAIAGIRFNGARAARLPSITSVAFEGVDAVALLVRLDLAGVAVSTGSACAAGSSEGSHVIAALEGPDWTRSGTVRLSLGRLTSQEEVEALVPLLSDAVAALRVARRDLGTANFGSGLTNCTEVRS